VVQPPSPEPANTRLVAAHVESPAVLPRTYQEPAKNRITFEVPKDHSRLLSPGIWFGVTETDVTSHLVSGWMWLMPDRRTIWLRNQSADEPVVFYSVRDGKRRELRLTNISSSAVSGYLSASD
jgi:hypothetical protein